MNTGPEELPLPETPIDETSPPASELVPIAPSSVPASGARSAFLAVRREISEEELGAPGVQKMLLDEVMRADAERLHLSEYVARYHEADKRAAVSAAKLKSHQALDTICSATLAIGCLILGLAPYVKDAVKSEQTTLAVSVTLAIGGLLVLCSVAARIILR